MKSHLTTTFEAHPDFDSSEARCPHTTPDVALIKLSAPASGIKPVTIYEGSLPAKGSSLVGVGFGVHTDDAGVATLRQKREATEILNAVGTNYLQVVEGTGITANGDSGGPLFYKGQLVGDTSCGVDDAKEPSTYYDRLTSQQLAWIDATVTAMGSKPH